MKAPTDKRNDTIQILVTRRCDLYFCSNCTQILPFRKDPLDMSLDVFRKAVRSLEGWPGVYGIFGGNPCSHPRFPEICEILAQEVPNRRQRGIWTNNLLGHGQIVRDTFYPQGRFNLNAHCDMKAAAEIDKWLPGKIIRSSTNRQSWHSPILMSWQDVGLTREEWVALRERCDINLRWSAAIMERDGQPYAYFCEVAGALDGVRGENNGIPAVPGWWRWKMDKFWSQVEQCCDRGCGIPLKCKGHLDRQDTYDYTEAFADHVAKKHKKVTLEKHDSLPETTEQPTDYQALRSKK